MAFKEKIDEIKISETLLVSFVEIWNKHLLSNLDFNVSLY